MDWIISVRQQGARFLAHAIKMKALDIANELQLENFKALKKWFDRFKSRNSLKYRKINASGTESLEKEAKLVVEY